jgi:hypothetical protein
MKITWTHTAIADQETFDIAKKFFQERAHYFMGAAVNRCFIMLSRSIQKNTVKKQ